MRPVLVLLIAVALLIALSQNAIAQIPETSASLSNGYDDWTIVSPLPTEFTLMGLNWDGQNLTAVGDGGTILRSTDGTVWYTTPNVPTSKPLRGVAKSATDLVAVGDNVIITSGDGITWSLQATSPTLYDVVWSGASFFAVGIEGDGGAILASTNGTDWSSQTTDAFLLGVGCNSSTCVAVGEAATIYTSIGGGPWVETHSGESYSLYAVTWANNSFVAVSTDGTVLKSPVGLTWTPHTTGTSTTLRDVAWNGSQMVAVGHFYEGEVLTSGDGESWTRIHCNITPPTTSNSLIAVESIGSKWVAVGSNGLVLNSVDGSDWMLQSSETRCGFIPVEWGDGHFVTVSSQGYVYTSTSGADWTYQISVPTVSGAYGLDLCFGSYGFVLVGDGGSIHTSTNGIDWNEETSGVSNNLKNAAWCGDAYFVVGNDGIILSSADGTDWAIRYLSPGIHVRGIGCGDGLLIASGYPGIILKSDNGGDTWVEQVIPVVGDQLYGVAWGNGVFVVAADTKILYSADGTEWVTADGTFPRLVSVNWSGGYFNMVGDNGSVVRSEDGITWVDESPGIEEYLHGVASSSLRDVAVGEHGAIVLRHRVLFADGFESGDCTAWSATVGEAP